MLVTIALHVIIVGFFVIARTVGAVQDDAAAVDPAVQAAVDASDRSIRNAVDYMVEAARQ
jgi:hypothetical protein